MAFGSSVRGFWSLNRNLEDGVGNNDFSSLDITADEFTSLQRFNIFTNSLDTQYGLTLNSDHLGYRNQSAINLQTSGNPNFAISFLWYSPSAVGYTRHAITRRLTSKVVPIIAKAESNIGQSFQNVSIGEFIISEVAASSTQNAIKLQLCIGGKHPTHEYISDTYDPGLRYIYVYANSSNNTSKIRFFIDGKPGAVLQGPEINSMPHTAALLYVNQAYHGYLSHKATQDGSFIADLLIQNVTTNAERDAIKSFRFGADYISTTDWENFNFDFWGASYRQPSTVTTNQIYIVGGDIYLARSNGEILRGSQPIWDTEFDYINDDTINLLTVVDKNKVSRDSRGLRIDGTTVRI
ncbi:hypothetical protein LCGC14_0575880 [marine sediment metagenome]|uniref:Uncharacterized protein n=1 Tax=marine sediment metagenome TaxID=412755 RepID=A0A0F9RMU7_9ZZZZ